MSLPNLNITLNNGGLGRVAQTSDGVAGIILTGTNLDQALDFDYKTPYQINSSRWLDEKGITSGNNRLIYKEVTEFYKKAGDGAELYIYIVEPDTTLAGAVKEVSTLIDRSRGRIRLLGLNVLPGATIQLPQVISDLQAMAADYQKKISPFRAFVPAYTDLDGYSPRESSYNRVAVVAAADEVITVEGQQYGIAAIGQVLGMAASIPVHYSIARVKNGVASENGWLTNGGTIEENTANLDTLDSAGYIIYRTFTGKNGYYFNDDHTAAPLSDDYSSIYLGRIIDKAIILAYNAYINEIMDSVEVDEQGHIPPAMCVYYENLLDRAILSTMQGEISSFETFIDPEQNILSDSRMDVSCKIVPKGILREININLGFENPVNKA